METKHAEIADRRARDAKALETVEAASKAEIAKRKRLGVDGPSVIPARVPVARLVPRAGAALGGWHALEQMRGLLAEV